MTDISLVIVGNPGAGKSFLANVLLKQEVFDHAFQGSACTITHDQARLQFPVDGVNHNLIVHNIPGLIEADPGKTEQNKVQIAQAFQAPGAHVIMFVFAPGGGGRVQGQDFAAYDALKSAFNLQSTSVIFAFNQMRKTRGPSFDDTVLSIALRALQWPRDVVFNSVFLSEEANDGRFDFAGPAAAVIHDKLLHALRIAVPSRHVQVHPIDLAEDKVKQFKEEVDKLNTTISQHQADVERLQNQVTEAKAVAESCRKELEKKDKPWWQTLLEIAVPVVVMARGAR